MRSTRRSIAALAVAVGALLMAAAPAGSITGGEDDGNGHPNVGIVVFYTPDGRFRCSGTLIAPRVFLTAAHCTYGVIGSVAVSFDSRIAETSAEGIQNIPRAKDDPGTGLEGSGYDEGFWTQEPQPDGSFVQSPYDGAPTWHTGTPYTHPHYSDFTDLENWNDTGVVILDEPITGVTPAELAPANYLDGIPQNELNKELFGTVGYGTEVRQADSGPQKPTPMSYPLRRQTTDEKGQKLTDQILQLNGNEHDPHGGGGTCFGDSGGPAFHTSGGETYLVGDTSYGYTSNCRYLGGYQRVDIPIVRDWVLSCVAELSCETKE